MNFQFLVSLLVSILFCATNGRRIDDLLERGLEQKIERSIKNLIQFKLSKRINDKYSGIFEPKLAAYDDGCKQSDTGINAC